MGLQKLTQFFPYAKEAKSEETIELSPDFFLFAGQILGNFRGGVAPKIPTSLTGFALFRTVANLLRLMTYEWDYPFRRFMLSHRTERIHFVPVSASSHPTTYE